MKPTLFCIILTSNIYQTNSHDRVARNCVDLDVNKVEIQNK